MYSDEVMKHFRIPQNMGEMAEPDGVGEVGNPKCGDVMKIFIKVGRRKQEAGSKNAVIPAPNQVRGKLQHGIQKSDSVILDSSSQDTGWNDKEEYISDIKFQTLGCAAAIATSSVTTELAKGRSLAAAENISKDDIVKALGGLPEAKYHCSILADQAIKKAISNYKSKR
jgi:nitrogen fixation protein NifU and related proteins